MKFDSLEKAQEANDKLEVENGELKKKLSESNAIAEEAVQKLNELLPQTKQAVSLKIGKDTVVVNFGVNVDGEYHTPEELAKKPEVIKSLLKKGSGAVSIKEG